MKKKNIFLLFNLHAFYYLFANLNANFKNKFTLTCSLVIEFISFVAISLYYLFDFIRTIYILFSVKETKACFPSISLQTALNWRKEMNQLNVFLH